MVYGTVRVPPGKRVALTARKKQMTFLTVDCDEQSNFYAVSDTGLLYFYRDEARNGNIAWALGGGPRQIGEGWQNIHQIICGGGGVIYAIDIDVKGNGRLLYFKDLARNGSEVWAFGGGAQVLSNSGWENYTWVFSGGDGILYAIGTNGDLLFFRDEARDGSVRWSFGGVPQKIGQGNGAERRGSVRLDRPQWSCERLGNGQLRRRDTTGRGGGLGERR